jgi:hypothetical protein
MIRHRCYCLFVVASRHGCFIRNPPARPSGCVVTSSRIHHSHELRGCTEYPPIFQHGGQRPCWRARMARRVPPGSLCPRSRRAPRIRRSTTTRGNPLHGGSAGTWYGTSHDARHTDPRPVPREGCIAGGAAHEPPSDRGPPGPRVLRTPPRGSEPNRGPTALKS